MKIEWFDKAEKQKDQIADYIFEKFGYNRMEQFLEEIGQTISLLCQYPNMGAIDPLFVNRNATYRSVIVGGLSKMVYLIGEDSIYIAAFWDCRQEPENQATQVAETNRETKNNVK